jgi:hypothetical protein
LFSAISKSVGWGLGPLCFALCLAVCGPGAVNCPTQKSPYFKAGGPHHFPVGFSSGLPREVAPRTGASPPVLRLAAAIAIPLARSRSHRLSSQTHRRYVSQIAAPLRHSLPRCACPGPGASPHDPRPWSGLTTRASVTGRLVTPPS